MEKNEKWSEIVYHIIKEEKEEIKLKSIYEKIKKRRKLTSKDLEVTYYQPKFHHNVRSALRLLSQKEQIIRVERGLYRLK